MSTFCDLNPCLPDIMVYAAVGMWIVASWFDVEFALFIATRLTGTCWYLVTSDIIKIILY